eukprot:1157472-Pelagomonas_calceolata.AAC.3
MTIGGHGVKACAELPTRSAIVHDVRLSVLLTKHCPFFLILPEHSGANHPIGLFTPQTGQQEHRIPST